MKKSLVVAVAAAAALATPAMAQEAPQSAVTGRTSTFSLTPYAGYMMFGNLAEYSDDTNLTNDDSWILGAQAKVRMNSQWALVGNVGYSKTEFRIEDDGGTGADVSGEIGYWLADAGLQWQLPFAFRNGSVAPFVQGGVGAVRYSADANSPDSEGSTTNVQFNAGLGLDIDMGPIGLQLMAKDYVTSFDWNKVREVEDNTDRSKIANNIALTAGLRINF
jgi:opacity protein-like surface antigen